jgi:hypothetical protein
MPARSSSDAGSKHEGQPAATNEATATTNGTGQHWPLTALGGFRVPLLPDIINGINPQRLLWLGGLASVAAIGIIEWPVALAIGTGSYIAEHLARQDIQRDLTTPH